ncbi:MAG: ATP-dependent helicase [Phormidesmis priestleyi]|uniref:ATP-dependent helicase n=1 Tax=Phormidesmis priestleyi TaxID=268141 RepID=A0A2W4XNY2_9CYAN|nr:MAG: ATP-dependent helicase [Phormidesmis priestleyi]
MHILHGTWIPDIDDGFIQKGALYLWVESHRTHGHEGSLTKHLSQKELADFLENELGFRATHYSAKQDIAPKFFNLPTLDQQPLPSLEMARYLEIDLPANCEWEACEIDCYKVGRQFSKNMGKTSHNRHSSASAFFPQLKELHFIAQYQLADVQLGVDLLFWYHYSQALKQIFLKDRYIPALSYKADQKKKFEIYPHWKIIGEAYEETLHRYVGYMPLICASGFAQAADASSHYDPETLIRHCSDYLLNDLVANTPWPQTFDKRIDGSLIHSCIHTTHWVPGTGLERYRQWQAWDDRITRTQGEIPFYFCFQLESPDKEEENWQIIFKVAPKEHPSLRIALADYWRLQPVQQMALKLQFGDTFEQNLLLILGDAARIYPRLRDGLETDEPVGISLDVDAAFDFLNEAAWILEDAGYKVIVPAWWTPQGRRKAQMRLKAKGKSSSKSDKSKSYFSMDTLVEYEYELAIGGEPVTEQEWQQLVAAQTSLVQFRGQWMELDKGKMQEMVAFWRQQRDQNPEMGLLEFMQMAANQGDDIEIDFSRDRTLVSMMEKLNNKSALVPIENPDSLNGELREYQKRGVSWLHYLESLGLNGCLADDMGLGKTIQVIARMVQEKEDIEENAEAISDLPPTLLIAPTSVVGNWLREVEKFAPQLKAAVHHGSDRLKTKKGFQKLCANHDLIITSFSLARLDNTLLDSVTWHRIVLDEAQNIKNPNTAQTKAILKLSAQHRLALTGTPVENRLMDLWSIFNFLNPGYLGKQAQFRRTFEMPIQRDNDRTQSGVLKKLVEPFILRRVKTDQSIIKDLPEKVEQKLYCNLTKEQASLYEATVRDVEKQLNGAEGIQRKGIILSTLLKLKQICNHPRQFLQDGSDFTEARSHKLSRLSEMVAEAIADGDSLLIFTQFRELGDALEKYLRQEQHYNTYYLHGGTSRQKRERMMAEFQSPDTGPSIFVLSLKAGGVGITLTKANHVFHFDRWWNPAVEDQATDRAFRIGQKKNVFVHKFVAIGTLEERIDQMIEDKKKLAGAIIGADESWLTELDNNAFKQLIALNKSALMD